LSGKEEKELVRVDGVEPIGNRNKKIKNKRGFAVEVEVAVVT